MSRVLNNVIPIALIPNHDIEDGRELAPVGGKGHLLGFACGTTQALIEVPYSQPLDPR